MSASHIVPLTHRITHFTNQVYAVRLIPALQKAADANEDAKVVTVLNSREQPESALNPDDFGLQKTYSLIAAGTFGGAANNAMVEVCR